MAKIQMKTPLVEMDGDEMTRVLWKWIKDILLTPYVDLKTEYYDLGLEYREKTSCSRWYQHESVSWGDYRCGW